MIFLGYLQQVALGIINIFSLTAFLAGNLAVQAGELPKEGQNKDKSPFPLLSAGLAFSPQVVGVYRRYSISNTSRIAKNFKTSTRF
jgi:hypothetical protein